MADGSPSVQVDYAALAALGRLVDQQAAVAADLAEQAVAPEAAHHALVDAALNRFQVAWRRQVGLLGQVTAGLAEVIAFGPTQYQALDEGQAGDVP